MKLPFKASGILSRVSPFMPDTLVVSLISLLAITSISDQSSIWLSSALLLAIFSLLVLCLMHSERNSSQHAVSHGKHATLMVGGILALALLLRLANLAILDPYIDEVSHILAAYDFRTSGSFEYDRAEIVTWLVILASYVGQPISFSEWVYWARLPVAILGALTMVPIYLLGRRISYSVGLLSALLWATSPWAIGVSRTVREYAVYPGLVLICVLTLLYVLDSIYANKTRARKLPILVSSLFLAFIAAYSLLIDVLSTLKVALPILFSTAALYTGIHYKASLRLFREYFRAAITIMVTGAVSSLLFLTYVHTNQQTTLLDPNLNLRWINFFLENGASPMHWWASTDIGMLIPTVFVISGFIYAIRFGRREYLMHFLIFMIMMFAYIFFFDRYLRPRYIFYLEPFFVILVAVSVTAFYTAIHACRSTAAKTLSFVLLTTAMACIFSSQNIVYASFSSSTGYVRTTNEFHDPVSAVFPFLRNIVSADDVFVTKAAEGILRIDFGIQPDQIYIYDIRNMNRFAEIEALVSNNPTGYLILDSRRNGRLAEGYPRSDLTIGTKPVRLIYNQNVTQIYEWGHGR